jgi:hypothetical protein
MRTTVTLDPDVAALVKRAMKERGLTFKQALNEAVRAGLSGASGQRRSWTSPSDMGQPTVNLDNALQLAGELEDEELIRKTRLGK